LFFPSRAAVQVTNPTSGGEDFCRKTYKKLAQEKSPMSEGDGSQGQAGGGSPYRIVGWVLQIIGMGIMFFGFLQLVMGIQNTVSHVTSEIGSSSGVGPSAAPCNPKTDDLCGIDLSKEGAMEQAFSGKIYNFIAFLAVGLLFMFLGLILRSIQEIGGAIGGLRNKNERERVKVGQWYGPRGKYPF
jgi:hypothetical protein